MVTGEWRWLAHVGRWECGSKEDDVYWQLWRNRHGWWLTECTVDHERPHHDRRMWRTGEVIGGPYADPYEVIRGKRLEHGEQGALW